MMTLDDVVQGTGGQLKNKKDTTFSGGVTTDSRKDVQGKIFFALKGDVHDGHKFLSQVVEKGVSCVVSHEWLPEYENLCKKTSWVQVDDTLMALQKFSQFWRRKWGKRLIGITGSNGKTSVKDFTATLLKGQYKTLKNEGSFNNHWGLPLTLLNLRDVHEIAVVEMGMNHAGEIAELCKLAEPQIVVVNNVGRAHIEHFGSIDGIAKAKEEIYQNVPPSATAVFNLADPRTLKMYEHWKTHFAAALTFGVPKADIYFELLKNESGGLHLQCRILKHEKKVFVSLFGEQNVMNLMAASTLALAAQTPIEIIFQQLEKCTTGWGRNQWVNLKSGAKVLFDGYNANPDSFAALLKNINKISVKDQRVIGVFSEMLEQGENAAANHRELGELVAQSSVDDCYFMGASCAEFKAGFDSVKSKKSLEISTGYEEGLALKIKSMLNTKTLVVIKGSRGGALERVLNQLDPIDFTAK